MMVRSPRIPLDLAATTSDIKARVRRVIGELEGIEQQQDPIFASPRDVLLDLVLATHELEAAGNVLSLINLATVRALEEQWGVEIDPLRFRANFYIDGAQPWEEFDWVGSDISIGDALFRVDRRNGRCGATNVDPETGRRDLDIPGSLRAAYGHKELGVYLTTREGGTVTVGDTVDTPAPVDAGSVARSPAHVRQSARKTFMCGGCYFIYEPSAGLPEQAIAPGTPFADIPENWRCPDCGTEKSTFRPHLLTPRSATAV